MFTMLINNETSYRFLYKKKLFQILNFIEQEHKFKYPTEVNLIIVNNKIIQKLNKKYRQQNKPTDILSFINYDKNLAQITQCNLLGDIYISYEKVLIQAKKYNHSIKREWCYLFTHGLLHLLGYDHQTKPDEKKMNVLTEKIMSKINVGRY